MPASAALIRQPVYQQLHNILRDLANGGHYRSGQQFLTERQIVERFGVSRPTANKALAALVSEGSLEFRKGVGTFVREPKLDYDIRSLVSFTQKALTAGRQPSTDVLHFSTAAAGDLDPVVRAALQLPPTRSVFVIKRLRLADAVPVILERRWVPVDLCPKLDARQLEGSIYSLWVHQYQLPVTEADQVINAITIPADDAAVLGVKKGSAGFLVSATGFSRKLRLWYERTLYRGDLYEFHHHRPAAGRLRASEAGLVTVK